MVWGLGAGSAAAQKPLGVFDCGPNPPAWAAVCTLSDLDPPHVWAEAKALSVTRGTLWLLKVGYHEDLRTPIGPHAARVRARIDAYGLLPWIAGQTLNEEWYEQWLGGAWAGEPYYFAPSHPGGTDIIRDWAGKQHALLKAQIPVPVVWITTIAGHPASSFRPVPANVDVVAIDAYVPEGYTFETSAGPALAFSEQSTTQPLVLIPQAFEAPGWAALNETLAAKYMTWLARPRWIALMAFSWRDRPALGMRGLESFPAVEAVISRGK